MRATSIVRRIDRLGRIVIPKEVRDAFGLDQVAIDTDGDRIVLSRYAARCLFGCESADLLSFGGHRVCRDCARSLGVMAGSHPTVQQGGSPGALTASASAPTDHETAG